MRCREGCPARFYGLNSHQAATTAKIRDIGISLDDLALAITTYTERRGARARESAGCSLAEYVLGHAAMRLPGTVAGIKGGRLDVRAAPRVSVVGVAAAAGHLVRLPIWRHHYGERLKELAAQPLA